MSLEPVHQLSPKFNVGWPQILEKGTNETVRQGDNIKMDDGYSAKMRVI